MTHQPPWPPRWLLPRCWPPAVAVGRRRRWHGERGPAAHPGARGWGSHHFMVGGTVKGKAFYGTAPAVSVTNTTAAADQYAATLAAGRPDYPSNLGFMG